MSSRSRDTTLASNFTKLKHSKPTEAFDPSHNKLSHPLNVLIIGASRGIGAGIANAYAQGGVASLILAARASSAQELATVAQESRSINPSTSVTTEAVDITSNESVTELAKRVKEKFNTLDIVIVNSGYSGPVVLKVDKGNPQDFQDVFNVNVQGTYLIAHHFIPLLKESNSAKMFIAVSSFAACIINGDIANTAYCISKFAQARLVEFLSEQYGADGILAVAVHPGAVNTEMADKTTPDSFRSCKSPLLISGDVVVNPDIPDLTDDVGLCGAFCVWLSREKRMWLNGRLLSATWDIDELLEKKDQIEDQDMLKFGYRLGNA
ncbi:NAD(P)-binding protein [Stemphylium lycopersici]|uniref:NAD(P)-binding protein n=1 Tax=Stemphylium lycopersici TaxID=183478 RepID=A0A364N3G4_STELY|nr:NAD(P)-binding protein [Stemphylium lycopersici]RAR11058.1 NAD(P)-binding protein [Stemphylium lycopersici]